MGGLVKTLRPVISLFGIFILLGSCVAKEEHKANPVVEHHVYQLGKSSFTVKTTSYQPSTKFVFLKLHDNETTAEQAATEVIKIKGGQLVTLENQDQRTIEFISGGKKYRFDPNRMFTKDGIKLSLQRYKNYHPAAAKTVERFSGSILNKLPSSSFVIAVHNNTDKHYSILDYQNGPLKKDARRVYRNPQSDPDDFVFTTDARLFTYLQDRKINTVLQDNVHVTNDGSLSYYFGKKKRFYVNVEAEHGHLKEQMEMIGEVTEFLNSL